MCIYIGYQRHKTVFLISVSRLPKMYTGKLMKVTSGLRTRRPFGGFTNAKKNQKGKSDCLPNWPTVHMGGFRISDKWGPLEDFLPPMNRGHVVAHLCFPTRRLRSVRPLFPFFKKIYFSFI